MSEIRPPLTPEETDKINVPSGISLREYLAGQAINGIMSNCYEDIPSKNYESVAAEAVSIVDAIITELNRTKS